MLPNNVANEAIKLPSARVVAAGPEGNAMSAARAISNVASSSSCLAPRRPRPEDSDVTLPTGREVPKTTLIKTMVRLNDFARETGRAGLEELLDHCEIPRVEMSQAIRQMAEDFKLLSNGEMHDITRDVILSSVKRVNDGIALGNPTSKEWFSLR